MGRLDVHVYGARNLINAQFVGTIDSYATASVAQSSHQRDASLQKTHVVENDQNPQWDVTFSFEVSDGNSAQVTIQIWNSNIIRDDLLAECTVSVAGLVRGRLKSGWYQLQHASGTPEVHIGLTAVDFGSLPPATDFLVEEYVAPPAAHVAVEREQTKKTGWDAYVATLTDSGVVHFAAIYNLSGGDILATSGGAYAATTPDEISHILGALKDPSIALTSGVTIAREKFIALKAVPAIIYFKKGGAGGCIVQTLHVAVLGIYGAVDGRSSNPADCNAAVEKVADFLKGIGY